MDYCVLVNISRSTISFWYQLQGSAFAPLVKNEGEGNILPLYFYVNGNDFFVGQFAKQSLVEGDEIHTFSNYFQIVKDPSSYFDIYGAKRPVKFLLYFAVEQYLTFFLRTKKFNGEIETYRDKFPLRFTYSNDIEENEKLLVESIFSESGYDNIDSLSYSEYLFKFLNRISLIQSSFPVLLFTSINGDLYIELYNLNSSGYINPVIRQKLEGKGIDPSVSIMAELIFEGVMEKNPFLTLNKREEINHLIPFAIQFLNQNTSVPRGKVTLSNGKVIDVRVNSEELKDRLHYNQNCTDVINAVETILEINLISDSNVHILLNGSEINTPYFIERLRKKYCNVIGAPPSTNNEVLKLISQSVSDEKLRIKSSFKQTVNNSKQNDFLSVLNSNMIDSSHLKPFNPINPVVEPPSLPPPPVVKKAEPPKPVMPPTPPPPPPVVKKTEPPKPVTPQPPPPPPVVKKAEPPKPVTPPPPLPPPPVVKKVEPPKPVTPPPPLPPPPVVKKAEPPKPVTPPPPPPPPPMVKKAEPPKPVTPPPPPPPVVKKEEPKRTFVPPPPPPPPKKVLI